MRADRQVDDAQRDFASYARARWSALVRSLVVHGLSTSDARRAVTVALARCEPEWKELRQRHDLDAVVWGEALEAAGLGGEDLQVADLLDGESWRAVDDDGSSVDLRAIGLEVRAQRRQRRRAATRGLVAVAGALLGVVGVAWASSSPARAPEVAPVGVDERPNELGLLWRAGDRVHLAAGVVVLPDARRVVGALDGAVYGDGAGRVVVLEPDGERHVIGHQVPGGPLVAQAGRGVVAWVDPRDGSAVMRVHDVTSGRAVAAMAVPRGTEPVALAAGELLFHTGEQAWSWRLPDGRPTRVRGPLGAAYSADGRLAVTYEEEGPANSRAGRLVVMNRTSGQEVASGVAPGVEVLDVAFAPDSSLVYLTRPSTGAIDAGEYLRLTGGDIVSASRCQVDAAIFDGRLHGTQCVRIALTRPDLDPPDLLG